MLTAYLDETGHSKDEKQRFNGMAGLLAPSISWEQFEVRWKKTLENFKLPFFHMKDFATFRRNYAGWSEAKRRDLYGTLLTHIEAADAFPVGSILAMKDFRSLTAEQQDYFGDPYYVGFLSVTGFLARIGDGVLKSGSKVALVFSDHMEFKNQALRDYEMITEGGGLIRERTYSPVFRDMREFVPLQAADIVAYELYKEYERQLDRPDAKPRYGYKLFCKICKGLGVDRPMFAFHTKGSLNIGGESSEPRWASSL